MARYKKYRENPFLTNDLSPREFFSERAKFEKLYPKDANQPEPIDFWKKKDRFYGLQDQRNNYIVPDPAYLKQIKNFKNENIFVLNFVADAFRDFELYINMNLRSKLVPDEDAFSKRVEVASGWSDYTEIVAQLEETNYEAFVTEVLKNQNRQAKVKDIQDFIEVFFNFYVSGLIDTIPFTTEGLIEKGFIGPRASGLCIEIAKGDKSNGYEMFRKYINNVNFKTYALTAAKFGFLVDRNVPYRLVANLGSPKMLEYAKASLQNYLSVIRQGESHESTEEWTGPSVNGSALTTAKGTHVHEYEIDEYGNGYTAEIENPFNPGKVNHRHQIINFVVQEAQGWDYIDGVALGIQKHTHDLSVSANPVEFTIDRMFDAFFNEIAALDVIRMKNLVYSYYNRYIEKFPFGTSSVPCGSILSRVITSQRVPIGEVEFSEEYNMLFFLKMYFLIRLKELGVKISEAKMMANMRKIENLYFTIDSAEALGYIQLYLKQHY